MSINIPNILKNHILPFDWDISKVWKLEALATTSNREQFDYLLDLPLWSSRANQRMPFDTKPLDVIKNPNLSVYHYERIMNADICYPIDFIFYDGSNKILDGVHRLSKLYIMNVDTIDIRIHHTSVLSKISLEA